MDWSSPMLTIILSKTGSSDASDVGMSIPHWNIYWRSPTVFRHTDFPPALGPDMRRMCLAGLRLAVRGTMAFFSLRSALSRSGWRALRRLSSPLSDITGIPAMKSSAICAFAIMKSISPRYLAPPRRSGIYGRRKSVNSRRIRRISLCSEKRSSFIWLSSSTTSAGSMNAVFPVADSSYMNPAIFFLFAALTGISIFPSRTDTPVSLSTMPSS